MRFAAIALFCFLMFGCALIPQPRTCPSALPARGASLSDAALEYMQLANDADSAVRQRARAAERKPTARLTARIAVLDSAIAAAAEQQAVVSALMDEWDRTHVQPSGWRAANVEWRRRLEVTLRAAERTYGPTPKPCNAENGYCGNINKGAANE